jgi:hypothetical protein
MLLLACFFSSRFARMVLLLACFFPHASYPYDSSFQASSFHASSLRAFPPHASIDAHVLITSLILLHAGHVALRHSTIAPGSRKVRAILVQSRLILAFAILLEPPESVLFVCTRVDLGDFLEYLALVM